MEGLRINKTKKKEVSENTETSYSLLGDLTGNHHGHVGIMIFLTIGDVLPKPVGGNEGLCGVLASKLYLRHDQRSEMTFKDVDLDRQGVICGRLGKTFLKAGILKGPRVRWVVP